MKAIILAAGVGNRLQPYTTLIPKPLLPVGGKPCITYIIERLEKLDLTEIIVCVNIDNLEQFKHELRDKIVTFSTSTQALGTAGEILNCKQLLDEDFIVHYADELTNIDYTRLIRSYYKNKGYGTLAILKKFPLPVGSVNIHKNKINSFREKQKLKINFWVGIGILNRIILDEMKIGDDLAIDIFPKIISQGKNLYAELFDREWIDIGNISRYKHAIFLANKGLIK